MCYVTVWDSCWDAMEKYNQALSRLNSRIGGNLQELYTQLWELERFYVDKTQTIWTRNGILSVLNSIKNREWYQMLLPALMELTKLCYQPKADYGWLGPYTFFTVIGKNAALTKQFLTCVPYFHYCFPEDTPRLWQYLMTTGNYYGGSEVDEGGRLSQLILRRVELFFTGYRTVWNSLKELEYPPTMLIFTEGDMHCGGKLPYIFRMDGRQYVYKPRNMCLDKLLMDALTECNSFLPEELKLPVPAITFLKDKNETGYMDFVTHQKEMTWAEAEIYFGKLGALLCFAKLFGIHDLHYENIMATKKGPVIIDLECALLPEIIQQTSFGGMSLHFIRTAFENRTEGNAVFSIEGKIYPLKTERVQNKIQEGFTGAAQIFLENREEMIALYGKILDEVFFMRLTPVATNEFYNEMVNISMCENAGYKEIILNSLMDTIENNFNKNNFHVSEKEREEMISLLERDLSWGEIPLLRWRNEPGKESVWLDEKMICEKDKENQAQLLEKFAAKIPWLAKEKGWQALKKALIDPTV
ncbi:DUF4135 domain-containing protein [Anaerotignum lactatifermentans]|uniref:DUF4135 domain-containing protein n=1 Tax=Anaerotignum lactatifermentans TaxID=160404 RepID=A0ABS2GB18_9FIRM|nr:DUF4135 domain-containing protein [Anaerotignum lactatifermentans]MBM6829825.1 DUF4135 domain-containing protein [Anaerotignum lactatifermentans]MBM6878235.1 DUF4135 domain-containing protein [Anaerotignum lactatifermentans]MBM6951315.1 DUF4135 domain-containing protein [Anaerotignum lactatifermentans]